MRSFYLNLDFKKLTVPQPLSESVNKNFAYLLSTINYKKLRSVLSEFARKTLDSMIVRVVDPNSIDDSNSAYGYSFPNKHRYIQFLERNRYEIEDVDIKTRKIHDILYKSSATTSVEKTYSIENYDGPDFEAILNLENVYSNGRGPTSRLTRTSGLSKLIERILWSLPPIDKLVMRIATPKEVFKEDIKVYPRIPIEIFHDNVPMILIEIAGRYFLQSEIPLASIVHHYERNIFNRNPIILPSDSFIGAFSFNRRFARIMALSEMYDSILNHPDLYKMLILENNDISSLENIIKTQDYVSLALDVNALKMFHIHLLKLGINVAEDHLSLKWAKWRTISEILTFHIKFSRATKKIKRTYNKILINLIKETSSEDAVGRISHKLYTEVIRKAESMGLDIIEPYDSVPYIRVYYRDFVKASFLNRVDRLLRNPINNIVLESYAT